MSNSYNTLKYSSSTIYNTNKTNILKEMSQNMSSSIYINNFNMQNDLVNIILEDCIKEWFPFLNDREDEKGEDRVKEKREEGEVEKSINKIEKENIKDEIIKLKKFYKGVKSTNFPLKKLYKSERNIFNLNNEQDDEDVFFNSDGVYMGILRENGNIQDKDNFYNINDKQFEKQNFNYMRGNTKFYDCIFTEDDEKSNKLCKKMSSEDEYIQEYINQEKNETIEEWEKNKKIKNGVKYDIKNNNRSYDRSRYNSESDSVLLKRKKGNDIKGEDDIFLNVKEYDTGGVKVGKVSNGENYQTIEKIEKNESKENTLDDKNNFINKYSRKEKEMCISKVKNFNYGNEIDIKKESRELSLNIMNESGKSVMDNDGEAPFDKKSINTIIQEIKFEDSKEKNYSMDSYGSIYLNACLKVLKVDINYFLIPKDIGNEELLNEKKKIKEILKLYDKLFYNHFKFIPNKFYKETLRPIYSYYQNLKSTIGLGTPNSSLDLTSRRSCSISKNYEIRASSAPKAHSGEGNSVKGKTHEHMEYTNLGSFSNLINDMSVKKILLDVDESADISHMENEYKFLYNDLVKLKNLLIRKRNYKNILFDYQKRFVQLNNRCVKTYKDIYPVEKEYKIYTQIKKETVEVINSINANYKKYYLGK
ncbi:hypothetical protein YYG_04577 [Plasmodium vinckei petteri]|uniref:Uncharacterized protein n=1 Tax=Plasmodium vinckei petteri TaxID=138298 RepID=W7AXT7_PLAVN|nr:hypothetical protein YYG_04577 [Plasmodium vinckei petteri]CAD2096300.1 conserved Plasmodium protein, unknown function [Plasmodium vinckei petteri]